MKTAAITAEYNPFHRGHRYHIEKTREKASHIVAVMSGNVVQRGEFAVYDKFLRAAAAVKGGIDLVVELPAACACSSASRFARGAVEIMKGLGCVDMLSFGCECGDAEALCQAASLLSDAAVAQRAREIVKTGQSYPAAFDTAVREHNPRVGDILKSPNNLLAAEYIKSAREIGFAPEIMGIKRMGAAHDSGEGESAMSLRKRLAEGEDPWELLPNGHLYENEEQSGGLKALEKTLIYKLRSEGKALSLPDGDDGLRDRLLTAAKTAKSLEELFSLTRTKRYTAARVRRSLLYALVGITEKSFSPVPYIRVLCANEKGLEILAKAKKTAALPISGSLMTLAKLGGECGAFAKTEASVSDIYALTFPTVRPAGLDYTQKFKLIK